MRDGDVPRFFVRRSVAGKAQLVGQLAGQLADPANPANPSFSGKGEREGGRKREGGREEKRGGVERSYLFNK